MHSYKTRIPVFPSEYTLVLIRLILEKLVSLNSYEKKQQNNKVYTSKSNCVFPLINTCTLPLQLSNIIQLTIIYRNNSNFTFSKSFLKANLKFYNQTIPHSKIKPK